MNLRVLSDADRSQVEYFCRERGLSNHFVPVWDKCFAVTLGNVQHPKVRRYTDQ